MGKLCSSEQQTPKVGGEKTGLQSFTNTENPLGTTLAKGLQFFLGIFSRFLGFDGFDWYLQRFAAKLSDLHGVVVVVVGWMDGWMVGWLVS